MDFLFELLIELFGGLVMEGIAELISRFAASVREPQAKASFVHVPRAIACELAGIAAGVISLIFARNHIISSPMLRVVNLALTPLAMAGALVAWGRFLQKRDRERTPLNHFVCAYGFAICYMLVRFFFAR